MAKRPNYYISIKETFGDDHRVTKLLGALSIDNKILAINDFFKFCNVTTVKDLNPLQVDKLVTVLQLHYDKQCTDKMIDLINGEKTVKLERGLIID